VGVLLTATLFFPFPASAGLNKWTGSGYPQCDALNSSSWSAVAGCARDARGNEIAVVNGTNSCSTVFLGPVTYLAQGPTTYVRTAKYRNFGYQGSGNPCSSSYTEVGTLTLSLTLATDCVPSSNFNPHTGTCTPPVNCGSLSNTEKHFLGDGNITTTDLCLTTTDTSGNTGLCAFDYRAHTCGSSGVSLCLPSYSANGSTCSLDVLPQDTEGDPLAPVADNVDGGCVRNDASGVTLCVKKDTTKNCGVFNGQTVCLDSVPTGQCVFFGNGDLACGSTATNSPPLPDNGTPGTPATPDAVLDGAVGAVQKLVKLFTSGTVNSSSNEVTGGLISDQNLGGSGSTAGSAAAVQEGVEAALEGLGIGDAPTEGDIDGASGGGLGDELGTTAAPTPTDWSGLGGWLGSGSCPAPQSVAVLGSSVTVEFDAICDFLAIIGIVAVAISGLVGIRIVMGGLG